MLLTLFISYVTLPILVGSIYAARKWQSVRRPRLFLVGGILEGYLVVAVVVFWAAQPLTSFGVSGVPPGDPRAAGLLDGLGRFVAGLPLLAVGHLIVLWVTHRGLAKS
jgi:hypothetical protein